MKAKNVAGERAFLQNVLYTWVDLIEFITASAGLFSAVNVHVNNS